MDDQYFSVNDDLMTSDKIPISHGTTHTNCNHNNSSPTDGEIKISKRCKQSIILMYIGIAIAFYGLSFTNKYDDASFTRFAIWTSLGVGIGVFSIFMERIIKKLKKK